MPIPGTGGDTRAPFALGFVMGQCVVPVSLPPTRSRVDVPRDRLRQQHVPEPRHFESVLRQ